MENLEDLLAQQMLMEQLAFGQEHYYAKTINHKNETINLKGGNTWLITKKK
jgi:hypothetical protein